MDLRYLLVPIGFFIVFVMGAALLSFAPEHPIICGTIFIGIIVYGCTLKDEESDLF